MEREINQLIQDCLHFFSSNCYTQNRIDKYRSLWKHGILRYMKEKNVSYYSSSLGQQFIGECIPIDNVRHDDREKIRSMMPDNITCHSIRHSKAIHLLQSGANLVYIRDLLGHVSIQTTEVYARADSKQKREALEKAYEKHTPKTS